MPKFTVLKTTKFKKKYFDFGQEVEMTLKESRDFIERGLIAPSGGVEVDEDTGQSKSDETEAPLNSSDSKTDDPPPEPEKGSSETDSDASEPVKPSSETEKAYEELSEAELDALTSSDGDEKQGAAKRGRPSTK